MWKRKILSKTGRLVTLLLGQFLVLIFCLNYIYYLYKTNILPDKEVKALFQQTDCFLISKKLNIKGQIVQRYRADFLISYNVNGVQYHHWVSGNGLDNAYSQNQGAQEDILTRFDVGGTYPCWYHPEKPQVAILVNRHNWLSTFPMLIPILLGVTTLYYFLKNLIPLLRKQHLWKRLFNKKRKVHHHNKENPPNETNDTF